MPHSVCVRMDNWRCRVSTRRVIYVCAKHIALLRMSFYLKLEALKGPTLHDRVLTGYLAALLDASFSACVRMDNLSVCRVNT
jgi:hypothetical protein